MKLVSRFDSVLIYRCNSSYLVYLDKKLFFYQEFLKSNDARISDGLYTYFYVLKIMGRFGLIKPLSLNLLLLKKR